MPRFSDYTPDERVIDRVVSLWIGALRDPKYDNGDTTGGSAISAAVVSCRSKNNDDATLARFGAELKKRLMNQFTTPPSREGGEPYTRWITSLGVDYGPDAVLSEAAKAAGLKMEFPWKTRMSFSTDNVNFREGYGADARRRLAHDNAERVEGGCRCVGTVRGGRAAGRLFPYRALIMAFSILIPGPNGTVATMTKEQVDLAQPILLRMANRKIRPAAAQAEIERLLAASEHPLKFEVRK
jgi:hypothetical protein